MGVGDVSKRILLGRKLRSSQLGETLLPKRVALPVFASDALSSVAYAPDEVFIMLSLAGASTYVWSWKVGIAVALVMTAVVASYRQTVRAYPSGGGDYEVAKVNLGERAGMTVGAALLVDYVLTVAVSISSGAQYAAAAIPSLSGHEATFAVALVLLLMAMNLRGVRESGSLFAIPTYAFMVGMAVMCGWGLMQVVTGTIGKVESADLIVVPAPGYEQELTTIGLIFLLARAFSSGCAALTGVEAISNGVPAFRRPKAQNAATTLLLLGLIAITMMLSVITLAREMGIRYVDPHHIERLTRADGSALPEGFDQHTVIAQLARAIFDGFPPGFYFVVVVTGIVLVLAANTAFNGFPVLGSILAKDGYAPRALASRGDRLAYSNGIVFLAVMAIGLIWAFDAQVTRLIQLYIVGVFISFTLSQLGMLRHWTRHLDTEKNPAERRRMQRSRVINAVGLAFTGAVLVVVLATKFFAGAWITVLALVIFFTIMKRIRGHYDRVSAELAADDQDKVLPTRVHAIVLVSKLHKPTLRALAFAKATRPNVLEAIFVGTEQRESDALVDEWDTRGIDVPLKVLYSPYRELVRPIVEYASEIRGANPRGVVAVYIPEYVVGHWWEQLLHNQTQGTPAVPAGSHGHLGALPAEVLGSCAGATGARCLPRAGRRPAPGRRTTNRSTQHPEGGLMGRRPVRTRKARGASLAGQRFEVTVGAVAHGGHCVARISELGDRVVFVRHTLPGEQVVVEITEGTEGDRFLRGDAVEVLVAAAERVPAPCPVAGPGLCGGCDFQHVELAAQRDLKAAVVQEQLRRLGRYDAGHPLVAGLRVEPVPGDDHGLRWRTRVEYAATRDGARGMRAHRSHRVVPVDDCLIAAATARVVGEASEPVVTETVESRQGTRAFEVDADGFWQVHPGAPSALVDTVLELLDVKPGESVLDLYAGVGLFAAHLASAAGPSGTLVTVEGSRSACRRAEHNLAEFTGVRVLAGSVDEVLEREVPEGFDVVVLDPPREGARRTVVEQVAARARRAVAYVACDPAALARDLATFRELGWELADLRAFDLFPMTSHVEVVAKLVKSR